MPFSFRSLIVAVVLATLLTGAGCTRQARMERHFARGNKYAATGEYDKAEIEYRTALKLVPEDAGVLGRIGVLYYNDGRLLPAYLLLQQAIKDRPDDPTLRLTFGLASLALAKSEDAREAAKFVLKREPANEDALLLLVESGITSRDAEEARQLIETLQRANPDAAGYHVALGEYWMNRRGASKAEEEFKKALALDPSCAAALADLGTLALRQNDKARAREYFQQAAEHSPVRSPRRMRYIEFLAQYGTAAETNQEIDKVTRAAPDYTPAWTMAMRLAFEQGRTADCEAAIKSVLARDPMNYDALMQQVAIELVQNRTDGVIADLQKIGGYYPRSPQVKYQLALAYLKKRDQARAEDNLGQALTLSPNYADALLLQADLNLRKGNSGPVVSSMSQLLRRRPDVGRAYILLAQAQRMRGDPGEALSTLQSFVSRFPRLPDGPYLEGMTLLAMNRLDDAQAAFAASMSLQEDYWPAVEMAVDTELIRHDPKPAIERIERLLKKNPKAVPLYLIRAKIRLATGDFTGGEADLLKAIELDPRTEYAYFQLARVYYHTNRSADALAKLQAVAGKENDPGALMQLGMLHAALKQDDTARAAYEKLLARDPTFVPALNNLAVLYSDQGQQEKAMALAQKARDLAPGDAVVADTVGWISLRQHQYDGALPLLEASAEKNLGDAEVQYHLGLAYYNLGREDDARQAFQRALASPLDSPVKADAKRRLDLLAINPALAGPEIRAALEKHVQKAPDDPVALTRLAAIEQRGGDSAAAAGHYEAALKISPRAASTMRALVELYLGPIPKPQRARELARLAHEAAPNDPNISWDLGRLMLNAGEYAWSTSLLEEASRSLANEPALELALARGYFSVGRLTDADLTLQALPEAKLPAADRETERRLKAMMAAITAPDQAMAALPEANRILATDPRDIGALMVLGLTKESVGDYAGARDAYEKLLARDEAFVPATRQLAILFTEHLGDDQKGEQLALKARQAMPDDPVLNFELGVINYRRGEQTTAVKFLQQSLRTRDNDAETLFFLGLAHFQLKNRPDSRSELQHALELKLPDEEAQEARRVLDQLERESGDF